MERWLLAMCAGCAHEDGAARARGEGGGIGCRLPALAYLDEYEDISEWSVDAAPAGPGGVTCMAASRWGAAR